MTTQMNSGLLVLGLFACTMSSINTAAARAADRPGELQVFILAGQSNMEGQGVVSMDHPDYYNGGTGNLVWSMEHSASKDQMRHLKDASGQWVVRNDVEISFKAKGDVRHGGLTIGYTGYDAAATSAPNCSSGT